MYPHNLFIKSILFALLTSASVANAQDAVEDFLKAAADPNALQISEKVFQNLEAMGPELFANHPKSGEVLSALQARANGSIPLTGRNASTRTQAMRLRHRCLSAAAGLGSISDISENLAAVIESGLAPRGSALLPLERFVVHLLQFGHDVPSKDGMISNAYLDVFTAMKTLGESDILKALAIFYEFSTSAVHLESIAHPRRTLPTLVDDMYKTLLDWQAKLKALAERKPSSSKITDGKNRTTYLELLAQLKAGAARLGMELEIETEEEPVKPKEVTKKVTREVTKEVTKEVKRGARVPTARKAVLVDLNPKDVTKILSSASASNVARLLANMAESKELSAESRQEYESLLRDHLVKTLRESSLEDLKKCAQALSN